MLKPKYEIGQIVFVSANHIPGGYMYAEITDIHISKNEISYSLDAKGGGYGHLKESEIIVDIEVIKKAYEERLAVCKKEAYEIFKNLEKKQKEREGYVNA